jgi:Icc-related predicted phosphoesterase
MSDPEAGSHGIVKTVKIICLSDTHELHQERDVPDGDILIHAGDFTMFSRSPAAIRDFNVWLGELPHRLKIVIPGNHEFFLERNSKQCKVISNGTVLVNAAIEIMGLKIWGSPTTPLSSGAFGLASESDRKRLYSKIPDDVDILVTHGPPFGILDCAPGDMHHTGCPQLLKAVTRLKPRLHLFGHVHSGFGTLSNTDTLFVNAALLGVCGSLREQPIVLKMSRT